MNTGTKQTFTFVSGAPFVRERRTKKWKWKLESDVEVQDGQFELELVKFLHKRKQSVNGEELVEIAKSQNALLGQRHAEVLFRNQSVIPKEWRAYRLFFPGTIWLNYFGHPHIPFLRFHDGAWFLSFVALDSNFSYGRLVHFRKVA